MSLRKQLTERIYELRTLKEQLREQLTVVQKELDNKERELVDEMEGDDLQSFNQDGIGTVYLRTDAYVKVTDQSSLYSWLRDHELGDVIKETINNSTLRSIVKDKMKEEGVELPGCETTWVSKIGLRKS